MKRSTERILTTHTGSLPRPDDLIRTMFAREEGVPVDPSALAARVRSAVAEVVGKQVQAGIDKLSPDLRTCVILRDIEELSYQEIVDLLKIPEGTVKSRINRGRIELAKILRRMRVVEA